MGKLINTTAITVDGLVDVGGWYVAEGEHDEASLAMFEGAAGMLLGRTTYEGLASFWPSQAGPWPEVLNPLRKYVASRSATGELDWNGTVIEGEVVAEVTRLKSELDGDLVMSGCGELACTLIAHGVVDELWFWVHPTVQGEGTRPYEGRAVPMRLLEATPFDSGVSLLRYAPLPGA
jgi:dihydrofolate reductase